MFSLNTSPRCMTFQRKINFLAKISASSKVNPLYFLTGTNFSKLVIKKIVLKAFFKVSTQI